MIPLFAADVSQLPTTWIGLIAFIAAIAVAPTVAIWQSTRTRRKVAGVQSSVDETNDQVHNNHKTNLRDDLTGVLKLMSDLRDDMKGVRHEIGRVGDDVRDLRTDLTAERGARTNLENRFNDRERRDRPD